MYLIDTTVISELRKGPRCDTNVANWYRAVSSDALFVSVLVIGEIRQGLERLRARNSRQASVLENWLAEVVASFGARVLPIDHRVAQSWGRLNAHANLPAIDGLLAATAQVHGLTLVTRNIKDILRSEVTCFNPFQSIE